MERSIEEAIKKNEEKLKLYTLEDYQGDDRVISSLDMADHLLVLSRDKKIVSMRSGMSMLDYYIKSFDGGELTVVSGTTGNGKTLLCQSFTEQFYKQDKRCLWFSYEVPAQQFLSQFSYPLPIFFMPLSLVDNSLKWIGQRIYEAKVKYGLDAVFIDHLHFLIDMQKKSNIALEIGAIMRGLKRLAMYYDIAFFLLAHTNRIRFDTEPDIDSLRDCLPYNQKIYMQDGKQKKICEVKKGDKVLSFKNQCTLQEDTVTDCCQTGIKKIFRITTDTGRTIEASDGHRFFAMTISRTNKIGYNKAGTGIQGWTTLKNLQIGQKILVVREYPDIKRNDIYTESQAITLGWIIGDGHITKNGYTEVTINTEEECRILKNIADNGWGLDCKYSKYADKSAFRFYMSCNNKKNILARFFRKNKYFPAGKDKYVLPDIMTQSNNIIAAYLKGLFHADGSVYFLKSSNMAVINMCTISHVLAEEIKHLLLRLGIRACLYKAKHSGSGYKSKNAFIYKISIYGPDIIVFMDKVGFFADKQLKGISVLHKHNPKRKKRTKQLYYERINSIEYIGEMPTYDISVRGHHVSLKNNSFCVEGFVTHNSAMIGCEADNVFFIWRQVNTDNQAILKIAKNRKYGIFGKKITLQKEGKYLVEFYNDSEE